MYVMFWNPSYTIPTIGTLRHTRGRYYCCYVLTKQTVAVIFPTVRSFDFVKYVTNVLQLVIHKQCTSDRMWSH